VTILPFIVGINAAIFFWLRNACLRESIAKSYIILFLLIALSTQVFSWLSAVMADTIGIFWIILSILSLALLPATSKERDPRLTIQTWVAALTNQGRHETVLLFLVGAILLFTLIVALLYPPNTWDSMTYHMSRVAEWIQHGHIDFYPTAIDRQNYQPPLAEFAILHFQLLSGSDRFANLIQWCSFFVVLILISLIAKELSLSFQAQLYSVVVVVTLPMAILQSSGTQNDLVAAAFCVGFAYFMLRLVRTMSASDALFCAFCLGLALLTKGTAYVYCAAIGLVISAISLWSAAASKRVDLFVRFTAIVLVAVALNANHLTHNYLLYGHPLSTAGDYKNEEISLRVTVSNIIRNAALHLEMPWHEMDSFSFRVAKKLLGDQLNNPKSTMSSTSEKREPFHEDYAGNPPQFLLIAMAFLSLPLIRPTNRMIYWYAGSILLGIAMYCVVLKWQPWASRLHTPLFMLSAPLVGALFVSSSQVYHRLALAVALILFVYSLPYLFFNKARPFVSYSQDSLLSTDGRLKSYFVNRGDLYEDYTNAAKVILREGAEEVGLCFQYDDYEYPLWVLVGREAVRGSPRFRHIGVVDLSRAKEPPNMPLPALIVATKRYDGTFSSDKNLIRGEVRPPLDPCLPHEHTVIYDSPHMRIWRVTAS
jgi:4-amino-4-deoxy-L-arabinose transferase-like glycosyltransferase